jgi:hypothetical protein
MAHNYTFVGGLPTVLTGLIQGVNADHLPQDDNPLTPDGATIVVYPGDDVTTDAEYVSELLQAPPAETPTPDGDAGEEPPVEKPATKKPSTRK